MSEVQFIGFAEIEAHGLMDRCNGSMNAGRTGDADRERACDYILDLANRIKDARTYRAAMIGAHAAALTPKETPHG